MFHKLKRGVREKVGNLKPTVDSRFDQTKTQFDDFHGQLGTLKGHITQLCNQIKTMASQVTILTDEVCKLFSEPGGDMHPFHGFSVSTQVCHRKISTELVEEVVKTLESSALNKCNDLNGVFETLSHRCDVRIELRREMDYYTEKVQRLRIEASSDPDKIARNEQRLFERRQRYEDWHACLLRDMEHLCNSRLELLHPIQRDILVVQSMYAQQYLSALKKVDGGDGRTVETVMAAHSPRASLARSTIVSPVRVRSPPPRTMISPGSSPARASIQRSLSGDPTTLPRASPSVAHSKNSGPAISHSQDKVVRQPLRANSTETNPSLFAQVDQQPGLLQEEEEIPVTLGRQNAEEAKSEVPVGLVARLKAEKLKQQQDLQVQEEQKLREQQRLMADRDRRSKMAVAKLKAKQESVVDTKIDDKRAKEIEPSPVLSSAEEIHIRETRERLEKARRELEEEKRRLLEEDDDLIEEGPGVVSEEPEADSPALVDPVLPELVSTTPSANAVATSIMSVNGTTTTETASVNVNNSAFASATGTVATRVSAFVSSTTETHTETPHEKPSHRIRQTLGSSRDVFSRTLESKLVEHRLPQHEEPKEQPEVPQDPTEPEDLVHVVKTRVKAKKTKKATQVAFQL